MQIWTTASFSVYSGVEGPREVIENVDFGVIYVVEYYVILGMVYVVRVVTN